MGDVREARRKALCGHRLRDVRFGAACVETRRPGPAESVAGERERSQERARGALGFAKSGE